MITIKSEAELAKIRKAGAIVAQVLTKLQQVVTSGMATIEIDTYARQLIEQGGGRPAFLGYRGYPGNVCVSINDQVVHGIPSEKKIEEGDIVSIDVGVEYESFYADAAATFPVGAVDDQSRKIISVTQEALSKGIAEAVSGKRLSDISHAIQEHVEANGLSVVRAFVGHGIGSSIHEDPPIPNYGPPNQGLRLQPGMVLAIEPMVNAGTHDVRILDDGWTAVTCDGKRSAHFEHSIAVTDGKPEILTEWQKKKR